MPTVTINGVDYEVYADTDAADVFLAADFSATLWRDETEPDQKARALVSATRLLDRMSWAGEKTDSDQLLAWPRRGLSGVDSDTVPQPIVDASVVLAKLIHAGSKVDSQASTQSGSIRRQRAGSVEIEYFLTIDEATRLPVEVSELTGPYLASAVPFGPLVSGVDGCSFTDQSFRPGFTI